MTDADLARFPSARRNLSKLRKRDDWLLILSKPRRSAVKVGGDMRRL
jgi:hypothetical protein